MNRYKLFNILTLVILVGMMFSSVFMVVANNQESNESIILESYTPKLGTNDNRPAYIKFQNKTGIYETTNRKTTQIESFVEAEWVQQYRDYLKRKAEYEERVKEKAAFEKTAELWFNIIAFPFALILSPLYAIELPLVYHALDVIQDTTSTIQSSAQYIAELTGETFDKTIEDFQPKGFGSELPRANFDVGESNTTHIWVTDPTGQTDGYYIPVDTDYLELNASRGQSYQHYYNVSSGSYTYNSNQLVNKTGVVDGTDWVTEDEYPYNFVFRLTNGSNYFFATPEEITAFYNSIDNSTIWGVGYESFAGLMGFYLNFADLDWGHGQYLYYPRLSNGQLAPYNMPQYAIYPHLYANYSGVWYDKILNDRSLYTEPYQNPRNTLEFYNTSDTFGVKFTTPNIAILGSTWNFVYGFKYNFTDELYHMINEFECIDRDFLDIGWGYEITSSPQSDGTPYQPNRFLLSNETHEIIMNVSSLWEASAILDNYYSRIDIVSQNNESFIFTFEDMEQAGFTEKNLQLHDQLMPDGSTRKVLLAGMYGYGSYTNNTLIEIDPTSGPVATTDNYDLYVYSNQYTTTDTYLRVGLPGGTSNDYSFFVSYNTGITTTNIDTISSTALKLYMSLAGTFESGEGMSARVYNWGGNANTRTCTEASVSNNLGYHTATQASVLTGAQAIGWKTLSVTPMNALTESWADGRGGAENYISFYFYHVGGDAFEDDHYRFHDSANANDPTFQFTYNTESNSAPSEDVANTPHLIYAGKSYATVMTDHYDTNAIGDIRYGYLELSDDGGSTWDIRLRWDAWSFAITEEAGGSYVVSSATKAEYSSPIHWKLYWTITLDWSWTTADGIDIDYRVRTVDSLGANGGYTTWLVAGDTFDNDLAITTSVFAIDGAAEYGGTNAQIDDGDWFRGGVEVTTSGTVYYSAGIQTFDSSYASGINVEVLYGGASTSQTDTTIVAGAFSGITYTPTSGSNDLDITTGAYFDVRINSIPSGGSDLTATDLQKTSKRDNQIPVVTSFIHLDYNSGTGYDPVNGYDDDLLADYTLAGAGDGSGSGLSATPYRYEWMDGGYGSWVSDSTPSIVVVDGDTGDADAEIRDNVGNVLSNIDGEDIIIDDDTPSSSAITESEVSGYPTDNAYLTGSTIYYDTGDNDYFTISIDSSTIGNSGLWKTEVDVDTLFTAGKTTDTSALPNAHNCNYLSGGSGTLRIRVVNNAGNYQELTYTATGDNIDPILTDAFSAYGESGDTDEIFGVPADDEFWFSNTFDTDGIATFTATGTDGGSDFAGIDFGAFGDNGATYDDSSPYSDSYTINDNEVTGSITVTAYDNVGNSASDTITMTEDAVGPSISVTLNFSPNDYVIKTGTDFGWTNIDITSVQDTLSGLEYGFFYVYNNSGLQSSVRWIVTGLNGDNTDLSYLNEYWYPTDDGTSTGTYLSDEYDNNDLRVQIGFRDMCSNYVHDNTGYSKLDRTPPVIEVTPFSNYENSSFLYQGLETGLARDFVTGYGLYGTDGWGYEEGNDESPDLFNGNSSNTFTSGYFQTTSSTTDLYWGWGKYFVGGPTSLDINTAIYNTISILVWTDAASFNTVRVYYYDSTGVLASSGAGVVVGTATQNEWSILEVTLDSTDNWNGTMGAFRIDLGSAASQVWRIGWIKIISSGVSDFAIDEYQTGADGWSWQEGIASTDESTIGWSDYTAYENGTFFWSSNAGRAYSYADVFGHTTLAIDSTYYTYLVARLKTNGTSLVGDIDIVINDGVNAGVGGYSTIPNDNWNIYVFDLSSDGDWGGIETGIRVLFQNDTSGYFHTDVAFWIDYLYLVHVPTGVSLDSTIFNYNASYISDQIGENQEFWAKLDEGTGIQTIDSSPNGFTVSEVSWDTNDWESDSYSLGSGSTYHFDGVGDFFYGTLGGETLTDSGWTWGTWVNFDDFDAHNGIFSVYDTTASQYSVRFYYETSGGNQRFVLGVAGLDGVTPTTLYYYSPQTNLCNANEWYFVVVKWSGDTSEDPELYLDGVLISWSSTPTLTDLDSVYDNDRFYVGRMSSFYLDGYTDDAFVYSRALYDWEIQHLYSGKINQLTVGGSAYDLNELSSVTDSTSIAGDPSNWGTTDQWSFTYNVEAADASGDFTITYTATDVAGNTATYVHQVYVDNTAPSSYTDTYSRTTGIPSGYYAWLNDSTLYFNSAQDNYFDTQVDDVGTETGAGIWHIYWDNSSAFNDAYLTSTFDSDNSFNYQSDSDGTFTILLYDKVGNYQVIVSWNTVDDITNPSLSITWNFNDNDYAIKAGTDFGWTDIDIDSTQDTTSGLSGVYIQTYDHSTTTWQSWRVIDTFTGDTDDKQYLNEYCYYTDDTESTGVYLDDEYDSSEDFYRIVSYDIVGNYLSTLRYTRLDRTVPDSFSIVMESGVFYTNITNDGTPLLTASGAVDSGSGLAASPYYFGWRTDGGGWSNSGYTASTTWTPTISSSQDVDFTLKVIDVVGNEGTYVYDNDNTVDTANPAFTNIGGSESSDYLYALGATTDNGFYGSVMSSALTFNVIGDVTDNFNLELANGTLAFGDTPEDTSITGASDSFTVPYTIESSDNGLVIVTITLYDEAGNSVTDTFTFYEDNVAPETTFFSLVESSEYLYWDGTYLWISDNMGETTQYFTLNVNSSEPLEQEASVATGWWTRTGTYGCQLTKYDGAYQPAWIEQYITLDVDSMTAFTYWIRNYDADCRVTITYSDTTTTVIPHTRAYNGNYVQFDSLSSLTAGKTITKVRFERYSTDGANTVGLEDVIMTDGSTSIQNGDFETGDLTNWFTDVVSDLYAVEFLETAWGDNNPLNDTSSYYGRQFEVTQNEANHTMIIKAVDNVGNWEATLEIIIIDESGQNVELGIGVDVIGDGSIYLYAPDNTTLYYGDDMSSGIDSQVFANPSFETDSDWSNQGGTWRLPVSPRTGSYSYGYGTVLPGWIYQDIEDSTELNVTFYARRQSGSGTAYILIRYYFTDSSTYDYEWSDSLTTSYTQISIDHTDLPSEQQDKVIDKFGFQYPDVSYTPCYIDDLVGSGLLTPRTHFDLIYAYNGSSGISHVNTTISWFGDSPSDSTAPYDLYFNINSTHVQQGLLTITIWTNAGSNATDTVNIHRVTSVTITWDSGDTSESSSYLYYDGSSQYGYYGDQMSSIQSFIIGGAFNDTVGDIHFIASNSFETGDFTGWTAIDLGFGLPSVVGGQYRAYIGDYGAQLCYYNGTHYLPARIEQLIDNLLVNDVFEFSYWTRVYTAGTGTELKTTIFYTDASNTTHLLNDAPDTDWIQIDLTSVLEAGKTINKIWFESTTNYSSLTAIDHIILTNITNLGLASLVDNTSFGDNPTESYGSDDWNFTYTIDSGDSGSGDFNISYTLTDNVGNNDTDWFYFYLDITEPIITWTTAQTNESSTFLYYDGSSQYGYYSDNMGASLQTFNVGGTASEGGSGFSSLVDNTTFGNDPSYTGSLILWTFAYAIDSGDSSSDTFNVLFVVTDLTGNNATAYFDFIEDNTDPVMTVDGTENSSYIYDYTTSSAYYSDQMDNNNTVLIYHFDEGTGTSVYDDGWFGNTGTFVNTPTYSTDVYNSWFNRSIKFDYDDDDVISIPDQDYFSFTDGSYDLPFSVELWIKPIYKGTSYYYVMGKGNFVEWTILLEKSGSDYYPYLYLTAGSDISFYASESLPNNTWTHLVITYDGSLINTPDAYVSTHEPVNIYYNGTEVLSGNWASPLADAYSGMSNTASTLYVGGASTTSTYNGYLDEVRLYYNVELTPAQVFLKSLGHQNYFNVSGTSVDSISGLNTTTGTTDNTIFGNNPLNIGSTASWSFQYDIHYNDTIDFGTETITYIVYDYVGNYEQITFQFISDVTDPTMSWTSDQTNESSSYLYYDGSSQVGFYSDNMESSYVEFNVGGTATDGSSGMFYVIDYSPTHIQATPSSDFHTKFVFGGNPDMSGSASLWSFIYSINQDYAVNGSFNVTYYGMDNVGNVATDWFYFYLDNHVPFIDLNTTEITESSPFLYYDGTNYYGFYSDNMIASLVDFIINGTVYDYDNRSAVLYGNFEHVKAVDDTFAYGWNQSGGFFDVFGLDGWYVWEGNSIGDYLNQTLIENVPVSDILLFTFLLDVDANDLKVFVFYTDGSNSSETVTSSYSDTYYTFTNFDSGKTVKMIHFEQIGAGTVEIDEISLIYNSQSFPEISDIETLVDDSSFGDNPVNTGSGISWSFVYEIDQDDSGNTVIIYTATDGVGYSNTTTFTFYDDITAPTGTYTLTQDPDALVVNWDNDTTAETVLSSLADALSGYNSTHPVKYKLDDGSWGVWNNTLSKTWVTTEGTRTLYIAFHDYCNNTVEYSITIYVDLTYPVNGILTWINPTYSDNWYKSLDNTATWNVTWTETNPYLLNATQSTISYEELESSPSGAYTNFSISIISTPEGIYDITVEIWDNAGNKDTDIYTTDADKLKIDNSAPTASFDLYQHVEALVANYYKVAIFYTNVTAYTDNGPSGGSGLPTDFLNYKLNTGLYGGWESTIDQTWVGVDQFNNTLYCKLRDNVGLESTVYVDWVIVDAVVPVLGWLVLNESYAPNWYDQSVSSTAQASINWVETYPFDVDATCTLTHTDDNSPSGGNSLINFTITGEADGSYSISIRIRDRAGNEDITLAGSEAPINLQSGLSGTTVENWFYFYFFKNDATGLDWRDFNTSYVLDEDYSNYTEARLRGALYSQKYLNLTSTIRFIVRNYFGDVILNTSYSLPTSLDLYITLDVNILQIANLYDKVMNMTIERQGSSQVFDRQIMPYNTFEWDMYAAIYNITVYIHDTSTIALDLNGTAINDFQANLTLNDFAMFVDAPLTFNAFTMVISEIWQFNILTNKDQKSLQPTINIYMNGSQQGTGDFTPGTIVLSRPTYGYYNLTVYASWMTYTAIYQRWITVESNAEVTTWTTSGQVSTSDIVAIAWNTNKGTGTLRVYDNGSLISTDSVEGALTIVKSSVVGLHNLTMNITVETRTFTAYADYTISDWSATVVVHLYSEASPYVSVDAIHTATLAVTRSDDEAFSGYVTVNGTAITVINGAGTFNVVNYDVERLVYIVGNVQDIILDNRSYIANDLTVTFDRLIGGMGIVDTTSTTATFRISFNNSYDNLMVTNFEYAIYVNEDYIKSSRDNEFTLSNLGYGTHTVELRRINNLDNNVDTGTCNQVTFTIESPPEILEQVQKKVVEPFGIPIILVLIVIAGVALRRYLAEQEKNKNGMGGFSKQLKTIGLQQQNLNKQYKQLTKRNGR